MFNTKREITFPTTITAIKPEAVKESLISMVAAERLLSIKGTDFPEAPSVNCINLLVEPIPHNIDPSRLHISISVQAEGTQIDAVIKTSSLNALNVIRWVLTILPMFFLVLAIDSLISSSDPNEVKYARFAIGLLLFMVIFTNVVYALILSGWQQALARFYKKTIDQIVGYDGSNPSLSPPTT
ncbi:MAG: hypothetical protein RIG82_07890 [Phycisphaeraceae bacterium]